MTSKRSTLAFAVLALLIEEPMHPYRMQRLLKQRGKDTVINVGARTNFYKTITRLERDGLISARETVHDSTQPDRTEYEVTEHGTRLTKEWLRGMIEDPRADFPEFTAALAHLTLLDPREAQRYLTAHRDRLRSELHRRRSQQEASSAVVPRPFLLEEEYTIAVTETQLRWIDGVLDDLQDGRLSWSDDWAKEVSARLDEPEPPTERPD